jgi:hypothetical protein
VQLDHNTVWLTQAQISKLFNRNIILITNSLRNIFQVRELDEPSNVQKMHIASADRPITLHNPDVIISGGYRVNSINGICFR